eukprot:8624224-Ditylum_brightwellii.AAC.1
MHPNTEAAYFYSTPRRCSGEFFISRPSAHALRVVHLIEFVSRHGRFALCFYSADALLIMRVTNG